MKNAALIAIGGGGLSAAASMVGPLAYLSPLPLLLVGLSLGPMAGLVAATTGVVVVALLGGISSAGLYGGMHALPSWLVVRLAVMQSPSHGGSAASWYPVGSVLCCVAALGAVIASLMMFSIPGNAGFEAYIRDLLQPLAATFAEISIEGEKQQFQELFVGYLAPVFVGMLGVHWLLMITVNGVLAQAILSRRGWALRPTPRWSALTLPDWMSWLLVGAAVVALLASGDVEYLALNLVIILATPFFFLGLAVVHTLVRPLPARGFVLATFYVVLIVFFMAFAGAAVAGLGVIEQWVGIRSRFAKGGPPQRSE